MATFQEKQLAQSKVSGTSAVSIYSPAASTTGIVKQVIICNHTGSAATFDLFIDDDGSDYNDTTQLYDAESVGANSTVILDVWWPMNNSSGNLAFAPSTSEALTITLFGAEIT